MEDNIDIDLGGLMKLFSQFNVLPRYLTAFNYAGFKVNETPKELEQCPQDSKIFGRKDVENIQQIKIV